MAVKKKANTVIQEEAPDPVETAVPEKKDADEAAFFVYLGPNIPGVIQKATICSGNLETVLTELDMALQKYPRIRNLLISDKTIAEDRVNVITPGTRLYNEYKRLLSDMKK